MKVPWHTGRLPLLSWSDLVKCSGNLSERGYKYDILSLLKFGRGAEAGV